MRRTLILLMLAGALTATGCSSPGVAKTPGDRSNTYRRALDMDMRQLADDWDVLWFADRQYRLTKYYTR